jgi:hypothetical protein
LAAAVALRAAELVVQQRRVALEVAEVLLALPAVLLL